MNDNNKINDLKKDDNKKTTTVIVGAVIGVATLALAARWTGEEINQPPNTEPSIEYETHTEHTKNTGKHINKHSDMKKPETESSTTKETNNQQFPKKDVISNAKPKDCPPVKPNATGGMITPVGCYDNYILSQFWGNTYCAKFDKKTRRCTQRLQKGQFGADGVILHGLWPTNAYGASGNVSYPQFCSKANFDFNKLPQELQIKLLKVYANNTNLIKHEWDKHGTCTTYTPVSFFTLALKMFDALPVPAALSRQVGNELTYQEIAKLYGGQGKVQLFCKRLRNNKQEISEIRFTFDRNMQLLDVPIRLRSECDVNMPIKIPALES